MTNNKIPFVNLNRLNNRYKKKFLKIINQSINNSAFIKGSNNFKFEKALCKKFECRYALSVNSGTDALIVAIKSLNFKKNDEIIMTSNTWISSAYAIVLNNAKPVFVDVNEDNFQMDINEFKKKITKKTKACVITHLYGFPNHMDKILEICKINPCFFLNHESSIRLLWLRVGIGCNWDLLFNLDVCRGYLSA